MKIEPSELRTVILEGRGVAAQLEADGRPLAGAMVNVLCDIACDREDAGDGLDGALAELVAKGELVEAPPASAKKETHRHRWGEGLYEDKCIAEVGCTAKPRKSKKSEAPAVEGGGS